MKKMLSLLSAVGITATFSTSLVSCGSGTITDVYLITDSGKVTDKSFNNSVYDGANLFWQKVNGTTDSKVNYTEPNDSTTSTLQSAYSDIADSSGAKAVVLSGYIHGDSGGGNNSFEDIFKKAGMTGICVDFGSAGDDSMGIRFYKDGSGFEAGMSAIIWSILNKNTNGNTLTLGTYGGILSDNSQFSVANYMVGFYGAVSFWNNMQKAEQEPSLKDGATNPYKGFAEQIIDKFDNGKLLHNWLTKDGYTVKWAQSNDDKGPSDSDWVSGSFSSGGGVNISDKLLAEESNVIMPVAGPQITDTLGSIKNSTQKAMVCGVDVDMVKTNSGYKDSFITSATIPLSTGTLAGLYHAKSLSKDYGKNRWVKEVIDNSGLVFNDDSGKDATNDATWDGKNIWITGGIAVDGDNKFTSDNLNNLQSIFSAATMANAGVKFENHVNNDGNDGKPVQSYQLLSSSYFNTYADYIANFQPTTV